METILLSIAVLIEVVFATYCVVTKSSQRKVRSFIRVGVFTSFVILTLISVIQWGFRWYGLAALLFIWAALGAWALIYPKDKKKCNSSRL